MCKKVERPPAEPPVKTNSSASLTPFASRKSIVASKFLMPRKYSTLSLISVALQEVGHGGVIFCATGHGASRNPLNDAPSPSKLPKKMGAAHVSSSLWTTTPSPPLSSFSLSFFLLFFDRPMVGLIVSNGHSGPLSEHTYMACKDSCSPYRARHFRRRSARKKPSIQCADMDSRKRRGAREILRRVHDLGTRTTHHAIAATFRVPRL